MQLEQAVNALFAVLLLSVLPTPDSGSTPLTDAAKKVSAPPPEIVILDQVPGCYGSVRFDHHVHSHMTTITNDCRTCHHDLPADAKADEQSAPKACRECHEPTSTVTLGERPGLRGAYHRQCLSCHKEWTHENACGFCHTTSSYMRSKPAAESRPPVERAQAQTTYVYNTSHKGLPTVTFHHEDHSQKFGLSCADCHAGTSCQSCHGSNIQRPVVSRQQSCYDCHGEARCVTCHFFKERERFDHGSRTGWYLRPAHASLKCSECHQNAKTPESPDSDTCRNCHAKRWGTGPFEHAMTGVDLYGDHALFNCVECHSGGDTRMLATCTTCHDQQPVEGQRSVGKDALDLWPNPFPR